MKFKVSNVCCRFSTTCTLNLQEIYENPYYSVFKSKEYDPKRFSALIGKCNVENKKSKNCVTFLVFKTGNIIVVGSKFITTIKTLIYDFVFELNMLGLYSAKVKRFRITNYCFTTKFKKSVDIYSLAKNNPLIVSYEPEVFINCKIELNGHKYTLTHKGKLFATGFRNRKDIKANLETIETLLEPYFKINKRRNFISKS